jgi:hypothetical protein
MRFDSIQVEQAMCLAQMPVLSHKTLFTVFQAVDMLAPEPLAELVMSIVGVIKTMNKPRATSRYH